MQKKSVEPKCERQERPVKMNTLVARKRFMRAGLLLGVLLAGCQSDSREMTARAPLGQFRPETALPLGVGRSFVVDVTYDRSVPATARKIELIKASIEGAVVDQVAAQAGDDFRVFNELVQRVCRAEAEERIVPLTPELEVRRKMLRTHQLLCMGHLFLAMAESPILTVLEVENTKKLELTSSGSIPKGLKVTVRYVASDAEVMREGHLPAFVVRPQAASGAATLALLGSIYARAAMLAGAVLVSASINGDRSLELTVAAGDPTSKDGFSETERESLALLLAKEVAESWQLVRESVEATRRLILAASRGRLATDDLDPETERVLRWRGLNDSHLEAANLVVGVAPRMFEPDGNLELPAFDGTGLLVPLGEVKAGGEFPVMAGLRLSEADRRAEEILRATHVDPRSENLLAQVLAALREDEGDSFTFEGSAEEYFQLAGISPAAVRRAAGRLIEESAVFGHPIVPEHLVQADLIPRTVPRVVGTSPQYQGPSPAFLYALSAGSVRIDSFSFRTRPRPDGRRVGKRLLELPDGGIRGPQHLRRARFCRGSAGPAPRPARCLCPFQ